MGIKKYEKGQEKKAGKNFETFQSLLNYTGWARTDS